MRKTLCFVSLLSAYLVLAASAGSAALPPELPEWAVGLPSAQESLPGSGTQGDSLLHAPIPPSLALAQHLMRIGDFEAAALECQRFLFLFPDSPLAYLGWSILGRSLSLQGDVQAACSAWQHAWRVATDAPDKNEAAFQRALLYLANKEPSRASLVMLDLESSVTDSEMKCRMNFLAGLSAVELSQWSEARRRFSTAFKEPDSHADGQLAAQLDRLLLDASTTSRRSPTTARWLSTFVPGSGQIYAGDHWNGVNALLINGLGVWLLANSLKGREWDEVGLNLTFFLGRYYLGNRYQAGVRAENGNLRREERIRRDAWQLARSAVRE